MDKEEKPWGHLATVECIKKFHTNGLYNREVQRYAKKHKIPLKEAYKKIYGFEPIEWPETL